MMVCAVILILAAMVVPTARHTVLRHKEMELKYDLRMMRSAIDEYKKAYDMYKFMIPVESEGYPPTLEDLVKGVEVNMKTLKFLRRIPVDPMTGEAEWGLRSLQDEADSTSWGGQNIYDVYSLSEGIALDGSKYSEW
jgi:general secretion pathway protein G